MKQTSSLQSVLTRAFMPRPSVTITICTIGGYDDDGNDIDEPVVYEGDIQGAINWLSDNECYVDALVRQMPDGYILIESDHWDIQMNNAYSAIEEMQNIF